MDKQVIWLLLSKYKDLVTNGLDLLAFLLVTPQTLRLIQPVVTKSTNIAFNSIAAIVAFMIFAYALTWVMRLFSITEAQLEDYPIIGLIIYIYIVGGISVILMKILNPIADKSEKVAL